MPALDIIGMPALDRMLQQSCIRFTVMSCSSLQHVVPIHTVVAIEAIRDT